ncbi:IspD/TarI family cytidylyltransferase [Ornithinimicrobium pratense]|uniref:IspD/TarI family cytidylyltransferase n=1 Tax=Ornithinimicrobium pratense TaxID=2593973 RepID=UPI001EE2CCC9|nr:IspD/TarI family cytidylyltransferase [Ornithinimicrobium pratense]
MPKALVPLGHGPQQAPIVVHALHAALACRALTSVVVVAPPDPEGMQQLTTAVRAAVAAAFPDRTRDKARQDTPTGSTGHVESPDRTRERHPRDTPGVSIQVVAGGAERSDSVRLGLRALPLGVSVVLVHDAARALTPVGVFDRVVEAVRSGRAAVTPALPVSDTVKQVVLGPDGLATVVTTLDRFTLRAVQTPQGFSRPTLERAHEEFERSGPGVGGVANATDDCSLVEACGGQVTVVEGSPRALKITTPHDLEQAAGWLAQAASTSAAGTAAAAPDGEEVSS